MESDGLIVLLPILFLIGAVALILICAINVLGAAYPAVALAVVVFAMVLLVVLCVVALKRDSE